MYKDYKITRKKGIRGRIELDKNIDHFYTENGFVVYNKKSIKDITYKFNIEIT